MVQFKPFFGVPKGFDMLLLWPTAEKNEGKIKRFLV